MRAYTLRGRLGAGVSRRLIVDDGRFTHGMIVKEFYVWAKSISSSEDPECILTKQETAISAMDASESNQIGWAGQTNTNATRTMDFSIVDPDHVITQDLFIKNIAITSDANFMVVLEPIVLSEDQGVLQLIKEVSQDV